jgi:hypothetical protein
MCVEEVGQLRVVLQEIAVVSKARHCEIESQNPHPRLLSPGVFSRERVDRSWRFYQPGRAG